MNQHNERLYRKLTQTSNLKFNSSTQKYSIDIPPLANIGYDTIGCHANSVHRNKTALVFEDSDRSITEFSFFELNERAIRLAKGLTKLGITAGDTIAIHTGQRPETAIAHIATYYLGGIALTLSQLYGPDTIEHIFNHSGCKVLITDDAAWTPLRKFRKRFKSLNHCIVTPTASGTEILFSEVLSDDSIGFQPIKTKANDPALLMYTSGSTGMPKGMLHAHKIIHAYYPTLSMFFNLELSKNDQVFWTPADWAWVGGLLDLALPAWQAGQTVVASQHRFDASWALDFMSRHKVTHAFMTPTALKRLAEIPDPRKDHSLNLKVVCTGGESLPSEVVRWAKNDLGIVCNEFYGLTEFNHMVGNCEALYPIVPGSMGKSLPGRTIAIINENGVVQNDGVIGEIASWKPDEPSLFLGYWGQSKMPESMTTGNWLRSGDLAFRDSDGYFWYQGRNDDLIKSSGYRIGPAEVEDTLIRHPLVAEAAVVGKPDTDRGNIVFAFIRVTKNTEKTDELKKKLQDYVKNNLAFYKYPREIEFIDSFPLTSSGKIKRKTLRERISQK